ncbi:hypothetical protein SCANM124S_08561 [Streptomyces canus]
MKGAAPVFFSDDNGHQYWIEASEAAVAPAAVRPEVQPQTEPPLRSMRTGGSLSKQEHGTLQLLGWAGPLVERTRGANACRSPMFGLASRKVRGASAARDQSARPRGRRSGRRCCPRSSCRHADSSGTRRPSGPAGRRSDGGRPARGQGRGSPRAPKVSTSPPMNVRMGGVTTDSPLSEALESLGREASGQHRGMHMAAMEALPRVERIRSPPLTLPHLDGRMSSAQSVDQKALTLYVPFSDVTGPQPQGRAWPLCTAHVVQHGEQFLRT